MNQDAPRPPVLRPRTIGPLGRPEPLVEREPAVLAPPLEAFADPTGEPPTGPVPTVTADSGGGGHEGRLLRNNLLVASGTAMSRVTGLIRTALVFVLLAEALGDAYLLANNTPNIIYELILGGILTATLIPLFTDDLENGDGSATSAVVSVTVVALVGLTLLTAVLSPALMYLYSRGSPAAERAEFLGIGIRLALLFSPQVFFYGLMALWSAVLNARHRFFAAAWAPVLNNVVVIAVLVATWRAVDGKPTIADLQADTSLLVLLGLGTTAGIALMALALIPALRRSGVQLRFTPDRRHPAVRRAMRLSAWTFGYVIANQVAGQVVSVLAEPGSGGVRDYQTAFQFFQLPHGLLAVSIMVTFVPMLGRADARGDRGEFNRQLLLGFRLIGLLIVPALAAYVALPSGLDHRTFTATGDVARALDLGSLVAAFAVGLPGFSNYLYALRGFYAMKDTRTPFYVNLFENGLNVVAAIVFVRWWGVVGLALAYSLAYTVAGIVAVVLLARRSTGFDLRGLATTWARLLLAGAAMAVVVWAASAAVAPSSAALLVPTIVGACGAGGVAYLLSISVLRVPGVDGMLARLPVLKRLAR